MPTLECHLCCDFNKNFQIFFLSFCTFFNLRQWKEFGQVQEIWLRVEIWKLWVLAKGFYSLSRKGLLTIFQLSRWPAVFELFYYYHHNKASLTMLALFLLAYLYNLFYLAFYVCLFVFVLFCFFVFLFLSYFHHKNSTTMPLIRQRVGF